MSPLRIVFFVLLAANLAFFAWAGWIDQPARVKARDPYEGLPRLQLVNEPAPLGGRVASRASDRSGATSLVRQECLSVGPFGSLTQAERALTVLRERGLDPRQRAAEGQPRQEYWVYISGVTTAEEALRTLRRLEANGIRDAYAMPASEHSGRVSVGIFSEEERAQRRLQAVQELGFSAELTARQQTDTLYWLDFAPDARRDADGTQLTGDTPDATPAPDRQALLAALQPVDAPAVGLEIQPCPPVSGVLSSPGLGSAVQ